jgi:hypothetical protein
MAAEMIQRYHRSEVPFMDKHLPKDVQFIKVFKPYEELQKAVDELKSRDGTLPFVMPHSKGTFLKDQCPEKYQKYMDTYIEYPEVKGYVKDTFSCDQKRKIKGTLVVGKDIGNESFMADIRSGKVVNVSIGFLCDWDSGGVHNGETYALTQRNIILGHLAGLTDARGKCPAGTCGINQDIAFDQDFPASIQEKDGDFMDGSISIPSPEMTHDDLGKGAFKYPTNYTETKKIGDDQTMTPEEQLKLLLERNKALETENKTLKDAEVTSKLADNESKVGRMEVEIGTLKAELATAQKRAQDAETKAKTAVDEYLKQEKVFTTLQKFGYSKDREIEIGGKKLKIGEMAADKLDTMVAVLSASAEKLLADHGLGNMPSQADRDRKLNPTADNHKDEEDFPVSCGADADSIEEMNAPVEDK